MKCSLSNKTFFGVWVALLILLFATWGLAELNLKPFNSAIALTIAVAKILLVIVYFMRMRESSKLTWIFVGAGFFWFLIMVELTLTDYLTRGPSWSQ